MDTLNNTMKMPNPSDTQSFWENIYSLGKVLAPWGTVGWVCHQIINKIFKYFSDSRDAELRAIAKAEIEPKLEVLEAKIDKIARAVDRLTP